MYSKLTISATYSGHLGGQTLAPKKLFPSFLFQFYINKKYVEVAINDFTIHLIISKWLRRQKCRLKRTTMRQQEVEAKEETIYENDFILLNT